MTYTEATEYLYNVAPLFQNVGAEAYKEGLANSFALSTHHDLPHLSYPTIHVAGTNGKGSVSHTLAAILQESGLRVGLYTSPHLTDFRERIKVNGEMISKQRVVDFVEQEREFFERLSPSFFELTTALALLHFREQKVDVAVVEVGLGGRLDCTNIIHPQLSIITNISFDHTQYLGTALTAIAREKAGIIKPSVPVLIGETNGNEEVRKVFEDAANENHAPIVFADEVREEPPYESELEGLCQRANTRTIHQAVLLLRKRGYAISDEAEERGLQNVTTLTGFHGRWQQISSNPLVICDTGHNKAGLAYNAQQLLQTPHRQLHIVIGMAADKDVRECLALLPKEARYYFTQASVRRALPAMELQRIGAELGLEGDAFLGVKRAVQMATLQAERDDVIFIGGSSFVVADYLAD